MEKMKLFAEKLREELLGQMESLKDIRVETVVKNCSVERVALVFDDTTANISPVIYVEPYYEEYLEKEDISFVAGSVRKQYESSKLVKELDISLITDWEKAKKIIAFKLVNYENNKRFLEDVPHERWMDLAVVFYLHLEECSGSVLVRKRTMDAWGISLEELSKAARENSPTYFPERFRGMREVLGELVGTELGIDEDALYVLSNERNIYGAAVALYPGVLEMVAEKLENNFYVLPSSVHELLIVPERLDNDPFHLRNIVMEVNATSVSPEEFLGNNIYYYNRESKELSMFSK